MNPVMKGQYNATRVLRLLWLNPGISRVEMASKLELNPSTITHIVNELAERGLVETLANGEASPLGGRKKVLLGINEDFGCIAGLELKAEFIRLVITKISGQLVYQHKTPRQPTDRTLYQFLARVYEKAKSEAARVGLPLLGVGCGLAGIVNPSDQTILESIPLAITGREAFGERVGEFINQPFFVENDANCCCYGEMIGKRCPDQSNFLFISGDWRRVNSDHDYDVTGIGMGLVINDRVHHGRHFSAGEFRSIDWRPGNVSQFSMSDEQISAARTDRSFFLVMVRELAKNAALLVNVLNLENLYLGGFFDSDTPEVKRIFEDEIAKNWNYPNQPSCTVRFSTYAENAVAYGAAGMVLAQIFDDLQHQAASPRKTGLDILVGQSP